MSPSEWQALAKQLLQPPLFPPLLLATATQMTSHRDSVNAETSHLVPLMSIAVLCDETISLPASTFASCSSSPLLKFNHAGLPSSSVVENCAVENYEKRVSPSSFVTHYVAIFFTFYDGSGQIGRQLTCTARLFSALVCLSSSSCPVAMKITSTPGQTRENW